MHYLLSVLLFTSCAIIHHVQLGDIDRQNGHRLVPFDIKRSEVGIDAEEAGKVANILVGGKAGDDAEEVGALVALFQLGPTTGKPVYDDKYADKMAKQIYKICPSGKITGLTLIRETNSYPVVSGEIVRITGFCLEKNKRNS